MGAQRIGVEIKILILYLPQSLHKDEIGEVVKLHKSFQHLLVEWLLLAQVVT